VITTAGVTLDPLRQALAGQDVTDPLLVLPQQLAGRPELATAGELIKPVLEVASHAEADDNWDMFRSQAFQDDAGRGHVVGHPAQPAPRQQPRPGRPAPARAGHRDLHPPPEKYLRFFGRLGYARIARLPS
jgi:hypothetical protein